MGLRVILQRTVRPDADGSCLRLRPAYRHHVWSSDVVTDRAPGGRPFPNLNILEAYTRECLASVVARRIRSQEVLLILADLFLSRGTPDAYSFG